jgi:hypothetical protein
MREQEDLPLPAAPLAPRVHVEHPERARRARSRIVGWWGCRALGGGRGILLATHRHGP